MESDSKIEDAKIVSRYENFPLTTSESDFEQRCRCAAGWSQFLRSGAVTNVKRSARLRRHTRLREWPRMRCECLRKGPCYTKRMVPKNSLSSLSDDELLRRLSLLLSQSRRVEADLVAHLAEVEERRLYLAQACSSMFTYCVQVLHLSEPEAYLRLAAARAARRFPVLLQMLGDGRLHLSGIGLLASHLTEENLDEVLGRAVYRTKRQIEELVAELAPKPDAPPTIRKLPSPPSPPATQLRPDEVKTPAFSAPAPPLELSPSSAPRPEPLSPERFKVTFTASREVKNKLERLQALTQEDLAAVIEAAVTEKLERLEAKRYGVSKKPRKRLEGTDTSAKSRYIPMAVRRHVWKRDGRRCTFVDEHGPALHRRAGSRAPSRRCLWSRRGPPPGQGALTLPSPQRPSGGASLWKGGHGEIPEEWWTRFGRPTLLWVRSLKSGSRRY